MWQSGLKAGSDVGRSLPRSSFAVSVVLGQPALTTGTEKCRSSWVPSRGEGQLPERSVQHRTRAAGLSGCGGTSLSPPSAHCSLASSGGGERVPQVGKRGHDEVTLEELSRLDDNPRRWSRKTNEEESTERSGWLSAMRRETFGRRPLWALVALPPLLLSNHLTLCFSHSQALVQMLTKKTTPFPPFPE